MKKIFFILFVSIFQNVFACHPFNPYLSAANSKLVFAGEVLETKTIAGPWFEGTKIIKTTFISKIKVIAVYRGDNKYLGKSLTYSYIDHNDPNNKKAFEIPCGYEPIMFYPKERRIFVVDDIYTGGEIALSGYEKFYNQANECYLRSVILDSKKEFKVTRLPEEKGFGECPSKK